MIQPAHEDKPRTPNSALPSAMAIRSGVYNGKRENGQGEIGNSTMTETMGAVGQPFG